MGTLKFKVGDKVRVRSLEWYNSAPKDKYGVVRLGYGWEFIQEMVQYCGKVLKISRINVNAYKVDDIPYHWQDWMLEDEVITEEEQQENKNSIETKEMTQEEVFVYLNNTKIICTSYEESVKVQVKLLELGIEWISKEKGIFEDKYLLFINEKNKLQSCSDIKIWVKDINRRIEPNEILAIQIKEDKPKFDPKTLQPFDKVLVRDSDEDYWEPKFFDRYEKEGDEPYFTTNSCSYRYCVPYNEETKHLYNTTDEAPEFYQVWKK